MRHLGLKHVLIQLHYKLHFMYTNTYPLTRSIVLYAYVPHICYCCSYAYSLTVTPQNPNVYIC
ncbi:hypothetical protein Hdeb2414_s0005g00160141 [Helianthus debilis subsp. tardiflorus]